MSDKNLDCVCSTDNAISRVVCDVKNCRYHAESDRCHAECIQVTPSYAATENDTACSTFQAID